MDRMELIGGRPSQTTFARYRESWTLMQSRLPAGAVSAHVPEATSTSGPMPPVSPMVFRATCVARPESGVHPSRHYIPPSSLAAARSPVLHVPLPALFALRVRGRAVVALPVPALVAHRPIATALLNVVFASTALGHRGPPFRFVPKSESDSSYQQRMDHSSSIAAPAAPRRGAGRGLAWRANCER